MRTRLLLVVVALSVAACASPPFPTAPDRPLFRLETTGVAEGAVAERRRPESSQAPGEPAPLSAAPAPPTSPHAAFTTSLRLVRPDGTTLTAPRLTAFAGQRANITILNQTAYIEDFDVESVEGAFIADPVIGMLHEGALLDLVVVPAAGRPGEAAVGLRLRATSVRKPIPTRTFEIAGAPGSAPVTIQTPRVETVEVSGAQRLRLGEETEWARVPDPAGGEDLRILGRVDAVSVEELAAPEIDLDPARGAGGTPAGAEPDPAEPFVVERVRRTPMDPAPGDPAALRRLADRAATAAAASGTIRVAAVRLPAGGGDGASSPLGEVSARTVHGEGVRLSDTLSEAHLSDWDVRYGSSGWDGSVCDPKVDHAVSGVEAEVTADGALRLLWTTVPRFGSFTAVLASGPGLPIDIADATTASRVVPLAPGRAVHPMFKLRDGATAAIVVEWTPDQPR